MSVAKVVINEDLCKGCKLCLAACPKNLLVVGDKFNKQGIKTVVQVNEEECVGCKLCGIMCPDSAINVYR